MAYRPTREQEAILAHHADQHARVLAGPGTGKSATLVALVDQLLAGNPAPRVKLLTFTRAATAELAKKVSDHPAAAAERPSTIHSFSISVLRRNPGTGDFPQPLRIADKWEEQKIVHPTLAHRIDVRVDHLDNLIREMAANWEFLQVREHPRVDAAERARFVGAWSEHRQIYGYTLLAELPFALRQALNGVRIMTMVGSKGLTVRATIIAGVDDGIVPMPNADVAEERRLLYVAMTRAKEFLFATWAGQRRGPTARAGRARVRMRRQHSHFFLGGPVRSQDGSTYLERRR